MEEKHRGMKFHGKIICFLTVTLALTCLFSCAQIEKAKDSALVKDTIMSYNKLLIEAAKTGDTEPMKDILVQREREKLNRWIASWHDSDLYMDAKLKNITFKNVKVSGSTANVLTEEDWIYDYRNLKNKQIVLPASGLFYEMECILRKKDNKWIITAINIKSEKKKEDNGSQ
jgi:hypothetical protein